MWLSKNNLTVELATKYKIGIVDKESNLDFLNYIKSLSLRGSINLFLEEEFETLKNSLEFPVYYKIIKVNRRFVIKQYPLINMKEDIIIWRSIEDEIITL